MRGVLGQERTQGLFFVIAGMLARKKKELLIKSEIKEEWKQTWILKSSRIHTITKIIVM